MARIDALPSLEIIRGLKGILDFYLWKGLPCVRAWPTWRPTRQSDASKAAALFFGAVVKSYSLLGEIALSAYKEDALDQPRTARDIFVSGVYGKLHEADMSDFLSLLVECRDFLSALTTVLGALDSIDTDELVVNVDQSVLPPLAATTTNQATQLTALQKLDDLQDALQSKALDRLLVRGMDQLFTCNDRLHNRTATLISGADGFLDTPSPPDGLLWIVTTVAARDINNPTTEHQIQHRTPTSVIYFHRQVEAFPATAFSTWGGHLFLRHGDYIRAHLFGSLAGDNCHLDLSGYIMTLET